jgi:tetratricopeptide (TPR) repeat protein
VAATLIPNATPSEPALEQARRHHRQGHLLAAAESYRCALQHDPKSLPALLGLSLIARQSGQLLLALRMAKVALAASDGTSALAWANCGEILLSLQRASHAIHAFRRALFHDASLTAAHYGLGAALALQENFTDALTCFQTAIKLAPSIAQSHFALAFTYGKLGEHANAIHAYRRAVLLRPSFASAWLNLGVELIAEGCPQLARLCYHQALKSSLENTPSHISTQISAHLNLGNLDRGQRRFPQAGEHYTRALALSSQADNNPHIQQRLSEIHVAFACLHLDQQDFPQAWQSLQAAEAADPKDRNPEIPNTRGILLLAEETAGTRAGIIAPFPKISDAIAAFHKAEALGHKTAASNRGNALLRLGRCEEALAAHKAALARDPHHPGIRYNLALTQLRLGDFAQGWPNYEIRWSFREVHPQPRRFRQPRWQGEALAAPATLLIYAEQGLGDTLQFVRYLPLVVQRCPDTRILLEVQPPLARLLSSSPSIAAEILPQGDPILPFTHHCPLLSLPAIFATTLETIPSQVPYLAAPSNNSSGAPSFLRSLQEGWDGRCAAKIGFNWAGNPNYRADHERSTHLKTFLPLLKLPNIHWISLQKGDPASQIKQIPIELCPIDASSHDRDLADTAATIAALDLILTTDTAIAHLAGALGKPLWLLLPWQSDWRWMQDRLTTPWYPAARLFRQSSPNNWPELIHRVRHELETILAQCDKTGVANRFS